VTGLPGRMAKAATGLWDWFGKGLKEVINDVVIGSMNFVIDKINGLTHGLSDLWSWAGAPSIGKIDRIPKLAKGGTAVAPGVVQVGEEGPEMMFMPTGASVEPLPKPTIGAQTTQTAAKTPVGGHTFNLTYTGPKSPDVEQWAMMKRDLAGLVAS